MDCAALINVSWVNSLASEAVNQETLKKLDGPTLALGHQAFFNARLRMDYETHILQRASSMPRLESEMVQQLFL